MNNNKILHQFYYVGHEEEEANEKKKIALILHIEIKRQATEMTNQNTCDLRCLILYFECYTNRINDNGKNSIVHEGQKISNHHIANSVQYSSAQSAKMGKF